MSTKTSKTKKLTKKLLHKYRLVILNEDSFEERLSFKLTRLNVFVLSGIATLLLIALTTLLIAFTPLREYIPGYSSTALKREATLLLKKTDSLQNVIHVNNQYYSSIRSVLTGEITNVEFDRDSIQDAVFSSDEMQVTPSKADSLLRETVAQEDKYNLFQSASAVGDITLFSPLKGTISQSYSVADKHYALDIVAEKDAPVLAAADGTVIFAEWTADTGHVIIVRHDNDLITVYKHNASLSKTQGEQVTSGEVIATVGNTGELSTGPHLHFEPWGNGYPINPIDFIDFN
jgi:murein DD-endopeptidase MepM/ murein hydrolase activator NlpD